MKKCCKIKNWLGLLELTYVGYTRLGHVISTHYTMQFTRTDIQFISGTAGSAHALLLRHLPVAVACPRRPTDLTDWHSSAPRPLPAPTQLQTATFCTNRSVTVNLSGASAVLPLPVAYCKRYRTVGVLTVFCQTCNKFRQNSTPS